MVQAVGFVSVLVFVNIPSPLDVALNLIFSLDAVL